jgi:methyl-accepting chemotaxis protein
MLTHISVKAKIVTMGLGTMAVFLLSIGLAAGSFATMTAQARQATQAHRLSSAVAKAYEQWTLDDDQSNMYAAVVALRDPAQHALAETTFSQAVQARAAATPQLVLAARLAATPAERALIARIDRDLSSYDHFTHLMRRAALAGQVQRAIHVVTVENLTPSNDLPLAFTALERLADAAVGNANAAIDASGAQGNLLLLILGLAGLVVTIALTVLITRAITRPLHRLTGAAGRLAVGDTAVADDLPPASRDELGVLSGAFRAMVEHQQTMVVAAQALAGGDLTHDVRPKGASDTLGQAFAAMVANLRTLVSHTAESAQRVDAGAGQLSQVTEQIGQASTHIAAAIQEVASGTQQQITVVVQAEQAIDAMRGALEHTVASIGAVATAAERAAGTAQEGSSAVGQTIQSVQTVQAAVQRSAARVADLGRQSDEIGQIVAAIDDIAEQTNLLALNAAIEAARAGEHGKGFTVVAAEVRKLAERASNETKEITARITAIQRQVAEVVTAMQEGTHEVEQSVALGQQAQQALDGILHVVAETNVQARAISSAATEMTRHVEQVSGAAQQVAAVATQTAAGAEQVSASTEEQSASAEEMAAGAQELAVLAGELQQIVGRFVLDAETSQAGDAPARRLRVA